MLSIRVSDTVDKIKKLINSKDYHNYSPSIVARFVLRILKDSQLEENEINDFFLVLDNVEMELSISGSLISKKTKLSHWFFTLTKPTAAGGGEDLRNWLIEKKVSYTVFQNYLVVETKDVLDFAAGFLLGISKSLVYDNIKGMFELLKLTTIDIHVFLYEHEKESLQRLAREYQEETERSKTLAVQSSGKFANEIINTFSSSDPLADLKRLNAFAVYLTEIREIFIHFCTAPYVRAANGDIKKFFEVYTALLNAVGEKVGKESKEFKQAESILTYISNKYNSEMDTKVTPLLLKFKFFEAGAVFGEIIGGIAQIIVAVVMLLWGLVKFALKTSKYAVNLSKEVALKLSRLTIANQARITAAIAMVSFWPAELKIVPKFLTDSPFVVLALKSSKTEVLKIAEAVEKGIPYFETQGAKLIDIDVAKHFAPSEETARTVGMFESSVTGGSPSNSLALFLYGGILMTVFIRRKSKKSDSDDDFDAQVNARLEDLFQKDALSAFLTTAISNKDVLSETTFFQTIAEKSLIIIPKGLGPEEILKKLLQSWVTDFEQMTLNAIKSGKKVKKQGIWSLFNSHINSKIRPIAETLKNRGAILLVDQRFNSWTEKLLNLDAIIVFEGKETTISKLMDMTVIDFYKKFKPSKFLEQKFLQALEKLEKSHPNLRNLFFEKEQALLDIENAIRSNQSEKIIKEMTERLDKISEAIGKDLNRLEWLGLIDEPFRKELQMFQYGKINPYGKCGMMRPDLAIINLFEGNKVYDFVHVMEGASPSSEHLFGSEFYNDFSTVIFGKAPAETSGTKDVVYTFRKDFLDKLEN